jgi:hypothetical protein
MVPQAAANRYAQAAEGQDLRHRVLIIEDQPGDPFMAQVAAEIRAIGGLDMVVQPPSATLDVDARRTHSAVAIRKLASAKGVEVWMSDATSGRSLLRQVIIDESPGGPDESLIALQTAEVVRTSLADEQASQEAVRPSPPVVATPVPPAPPETRGDKSSVQAGITFLSSPGNSGAALQTWFSYQYTWLPQFGFALDVSTPLVKGTLNGSQGSAAIGATLLGGGLFARFQNDSARLSLAATLGGAFAAVRVDGRPTTSFDGKSITVHSGVAYFRLQGGWNPKHWLGLGASAMFGTTTTRVHIQFADQNVGEWGVPIVAAGIYSEIRWD